MSTTTNKASALARIREQRVQHPKRTINLVVRLAKEEMAQVAANARQMNITRSEYCRGVILGHRIRDKTPEMRELNQNLIRGCGNLNQFQKYLNTYGKDDATAQKIKGIIDWFHQLRNNNNTNSNNYGNNKQQH